jgi:hypothetical protein
MNVIAEGVETKTSLRFWPTMHVQGICSDILYSSSCWKLTCIKKMEQAP